MSKFLTRICTNGTYRVIEWPLSIVKSLQSNFFINDFAPVKNILISVAKSYSSSEVVFKKAEEIEIRAENSMVMCGSLASMAYSGFVYPPMEKMDSREVLLGIHDYLNDLTNNEWIDAHWYFSDTAWSSWFIGADFDYTYIIVLKDFSKCYLICLTDTD